MPPKSCELRIYKWEKPPGSESAVATARDFIKQKYSAMKKIVFAKMCCDGYAWTLEGKVLFKRANLFTVEKSFKIKVSTTSGAVTSYEDSESCKHGKQQKAGATAYVTDASKPVVETIFSQRLITRRYCLFLLVIACAIVLIILRQIGLLQLFVFLLT